ncbi:hypothetical protein X730_26855 [Mesorhizobium sp. L103C565B0]|nr:hypothetical protein X730_26855 [Mesorhizobium sp. L103C565B0]
MAGARRKDGFLPYAADFPAFGGSARLARRAD